MNDTFINYVEQLLDLAERNDIFCLTSRAFNEFATEVRETMAKGKPMKPIHKEKNLYCPNCDHWLLWDDAIPNEWDNYCGICGQKIDWEDEA